MGYIAWFNLLSQTLITHTHTHTLFYRKGYTRKWQLLWQQLLLLLAVPPFLLCQTAGILEWDIWLRTLNKDFYTLSSTPDVLWFTVRQPSNSKSLVCAPWVSVFCQAQVNVPPVDVDSWKPFVPHSLCSHSPLSTPKLWHFSPVHGVLLLF